jgi:hypothetical protein
MTKEVRIELTEAQKAKIKAATGKTMSELKVTSVGDNVAVSTSETSTRLSEQGLRGQVGEQGMRGGEIGESGLRESGLKESGLKESGLKESGLKESGLKESGLKESGLRGGSDGD